MLRLTMTAGGPALVRAGHTAVSGLGVSKTPTPHGERPLLPMSYIGRYSIGAATGAPARVSGFRGVMDTRALMTNHAIMGGKDPLVRATAERIISGIYGKDYLSEAAALGYWVSDQRNIRYTRDPAKVELVKTARMVLLTRQADCDELSVLLAAMLHAIGITEVRFVLVGFAPGALSHTFVEFQDTRSGAWVALDPVAGPGTGPMLRRAVNYRAGEPLKSLVPTARRAA